MSKFKDRTLDAVYQECMRAYHDPLSFLYWKGEQRRGSSGRCHFWDAFNEQGRTPPRGTIGYAYWAAGRDCRIKFPETVIK